MHFIAIINPDSGGVPENAGALLEAELAKYDASFEICHCKGEALAETCKGISQKKADGLIAWGGDGTLACVLNYSRELDLPVIPLPGGTMNLLCKRLHGKEANWQSHLKAAFDNQRVMDIPAVFIGDHAAYVGVLMGRLTRLAKSREHLRFGKIGTAVMTLVEEEVLDLRTELNVRTETLDWSATAIGIFVPEPGTSDMTIASIDPDGVTDLIETGFSSIFGDWQQAEGVSLHKAGRIDVTSSAHDIPATLDGELTEVDMPVSIRLEEKAARIWSIQAS